MATSLLACGGDDGSAALAGPGQSFNLSSAVALMQLCLESYQMLTDFENGQPFTLPAAYMLQQQFYTEDHFSGDGLNGMAPIAFVATSGSSIFVVFRDHSSCDYFATLCGQTSNPTQCKAMGQGINNCNFS